MSFKRNGGLRTVQRRLHLPRSYDFRLLITNDLQLSAVCKQIGNNAAPHVCAMGQSIRLANHCVTAGAVYNRTEYVSAAVIRAPTS